MTGEIAKRLKVFERVLAEVPEIVYAGNPVLRRQTAAVSLAEGLEVAKRLEGVLRRYRAVTGGGRGLAAPQIGESKSVFITCIDDVIEVFLNPRIVEKSVATNFYRELCISAALVAADVERPEWIVLEWTDGNGGRRSQKFDGVKGRLLQHEEAHLRGRLNLDEAVHGGIQFATFDPSKEQPRKTLRE
jgi:peptide deformylase